MRTGFAVLLMLMGCSGLQPRQGPIASAMAPNPDLQKQVMGSTGVTDLATGANVQTLPKAGKEQAVPKELEHAEVTVNWKDQTNRARLAVFLMDDQWMFWKRQDHGDGRTTYTFVRPKGVRTSLDTITPKP